MRVRGANGSAGLVALNREYAAVLLDDDADGVDDRFSRLSWERLLSHAPRTNTGSSAVANAGAKRMIAIGEAVELDGLLSHDADASFLTVDWTLAIKPVGSAAALDFAKPLTPSFTPDLPGYYMFTLKVREYRRRCVRLRDHPCRAGLAISMARPTRANAHGSAGRGFARNRSFARREQQPSRGPDQ